MKITLEKQDLLGILSKALGYPIADDDVTVQADPFEVHIRSVNVGELAAQKEQEAENTGPAPVSTYTGQLPDETPVPVRTPAPPKSQVLTMEDVLNKNNELLNRPLGPGETEEPPPITEEELYGRRTYGR